MGHAGSFSHFAEFFSFSFPVSEREGCTYEIDRENRERIGRVNDCEAGKRCSRAQTLPHLRYFFK